MRSIIGLNPLIICLTASLGILFILGWLNPQPNKLLFRHFSLLQRSVIIEKLIHNVVMVLFFAIPIIAFIIGAIKYAI